jgi:hypothetical protein
LLDATAPKLTAVARAQVLRAAVGNPLALLEFPAVVDRQEDELWLAAGLALTERLEHAFAARVSDLSEATRLFLLVAALDDGDAVGEILEAASMVAGTALDLDVATPAADARITDENVKGWVQEFLLARVTPNEKSRRLGTVEPAAHRLPH